MVGYINSVLDREYKICSPELFVSLTKSSRVAQLIDDYRGGNEKSKQLLPAFIFQGFNPDALLGKSKCLRNAKHLQPTGMFIMDFDHVDDPRSLYYDKFLVNAEAMGLDWKRDVALAHITPSGKGLRLVIRCFQGMTIKDCQQHISRGMFIDCDEVVTDYSRLSFVPKHEDILFINKELLFNPTPALPHVGGGTKIETISIEENATVENVVDNTTINNAPSHEGEGWGGVFPSTYTAEGFTLRYKDIVNQLIVLAGGVPQLGNRNNVIFGLARDLAFITDRSAPWLETLIPDFGLPTEEWRSTIAGVCKEPQRTLMPKNLSEAIERCKLMQLEHATEEKRVRDAGAYPPPMPSELPRFIQLLTSRVLDFQKPAVANMVFPALSAYVNDCKFVFEDNTEQELGLMGVLVGKQSVGKGCISKPIEIIMRRIVDRDEINRERERAWAESQQNKKANEKGEKRPMFPIRYLDSDTTNAAILQRLYAAEKGDERGRNLCCFSKVDEIEELYSFCSSSGRSRISQMIKKTWDRGRIGAERFTASAANFKTVLRWNFVASTTFDGVRRFFKNSMTDGTLSRIDFAMIKAPAEKVTFKYGTYDKAFCDEVDTYITNLENFTPETDPDGNRLPVRFEKVSELEAKMNAYIDEASDSEPDDTFQSYAWRAKVMAVKKIILLYIANGCKWEDAFVPFAWWSFDYSMWNKMNLFYEKASEAFREEELTINGHRSPIRMMKRAFTFADFKVACEKLSIKSSPSLTLARYRNRGLIVDKGENEYLLTEKACERFGIEA